MGGIPSKPQEGKSLKVIGAGYSRTGTVSMQMALEKLLDGPVMHGGTTILGREDEHCKKWVQAYRAKRLGDFELTCDLIRELTAGFVAVTDMPPLDFIPELMAVYPEARVVLVTRDPESWLASIRPVARNSSLDNWLVQYALWPIPGWRHFPALSAEFGTSTKEYLGIVDDSIANPLPCVELLQNWNARVKATVPEDKLLIMELKQGWEPLCGFLGLPVPDEPLPRANDATAAGEAYQEISDRVREIWLNGFAVAGVVGRKQYRDQKRYCLPDMPYTCEVEGCGRVYQRKEHLNRHKKDHDEVKSFECPACGAKFSRGDTLRRHMNLHGPRAEGPLPARVAKACVNCHKSKTRCDGREPTCSPCADKGRECAYPKRDGGGSGGGGGGDNDAPKVSPPTSHPVDQVNTAQDAIMTMDSMDVDVGMDVVPTMPIMDMDMAINTGSDPSAQIVGQQHMASASMPGYTEFLPLPPDLETQVQVLTAPTPPAPPNALQDPRNHKLAEAYFTVFHPHWPLVHRDTFMNNPQPELLTRAVMVTGLFFQGSVEARALAVRHHRKLLREAQDKVVILSKKTRQSLLSAPSPALLPHLQGILLTMILPTYLRDRAIDVTLAMSPVLTTVLAACGAHDQRRIDAANPLDRDSTAPWLLRESYQRLALLHYKLHLLASAIFVSLIPWNRIDRSLTPDMLHVRAPFSRHWWERLPVTWDPAVVPPFGGGGGGGGDDGLHQEQQRRDDESFVLVSAIANRARAAGTTEGLLPLFAWDRDFALAMGCWCTKPETERDDHFVARLRPYLANTLNISGDEIMPSLEA
ncbi:hypothetical protein PspLS_00092 [Pyricularia sp. CBS 133598]|nr:hypothetical protein PspLS_00092 [Pyricularia sp. CBS 133598]